MTDEWQDLESVEYAEHTDGGENGAAICYGVIVPHHLIFGDDEEDDEKLPPGIALIWNREDDVTIVAINRTIVSHKEPGGFHLKHPTYEESLALARYCEKLDVKYRGKWLVTAWHGTWCDEKETK